MALYHKATVTPGKAEMIAAWAPSQSWFPAGAGCEVVGAFRFDDPDGQVGIETHLVMAGDMVMQVPLTYRNDPLAGSEAALLGEMEHSTLGTRWVYDATADDIYLAMLAGAAMTGQGEALGMVVYDGRWHIAPSQVRLRGGGWGMERVAVDGFQVTSQDDASPVFANDRFELTFMRRPVVVGDQPPLGLTATWDQQAEPVLLAQVSELTA